jgi:anaerobic ribonucleoside-triphosphate reductase activating protein
MYYAEIKKHDIANGTGIRVSLFVSGCTHHCKNCFNQETWDFHYGREFTDTTTEEILDALKPSYIAGLSILGGEPFEHINQQGLLPLLRKVKKTYPQKNIWCYTGYLYDRDIIGEMCHKWEETREILSYIDILIDGEFIEELKQANLLFRGSANQRSILVQESLQSNSIVLWTPPDE